MAPEDRQLVSSYGPGRFRVNGALYTTPILISRNRTQLWPVGGIEEVSWAGIETLIAPGTRDFDLLLLGCGRRMLPVAASLRAAFRAAGVTLEPMDSGAACRTYNLLIAENRRVAAALFPV